MKILLALAMVLHGAAHLAGFAESWQFARTKHAPLKTTVLSGHVDLGLAGIRAAGLLWLLAALAFGIIAAAVVMGTRWWTSAALVTAIVSLVLTLVWWPESRIGVAVNIVLITTLVTGRQLGFI